MAYNDHFVPDALTSSHNKVSQSTHLISWYYNCTQHEGLNRLTKLVSAWAKKGKEMGYLQSTTLQAAAFAKKSAQLHWCTFSRFSLYNSFFFFLFFGGRAGFSPQVINKKPLAMN